MTRTVERLIKGLLKHDSIDIEIQRLEHELTDLRAVKESVSDVSNIIEECYGRFVDFMKMKENDTAFYRMSPTKRKYSILDWCEGQVQAYRIPKYNKYQLAEKMYMRYLKEVSKAYGEIRFLP